MRCQKATLTVEVPVLKVKLLFLDENCVWSAWFEKFVILKAVTPPSAWAG